MFCEHIKIKIAQLIFRFALADVVHYMPIFFVGRNLKPEMYSADHFFLSFNEVRRGTKKIWEGYDI